jgi:hypothetical protein
MATCGKYVITKKRINNIFIVRRQDLEALTTMTTICGAKCPHIS